MRSSFRRDHNDMVPSFVASACAMDSLLDGVGRNSVPIVEDFCELHVPVDVGRVNALQRDKPVAHPDGAVRTIHPFNRQPEAIGAAALIHENGLADWFYLVILVHGSPSIACISKVGTPCALVL
jgi:hypothetical protein